MIKKGTKLYSILHSKCPTCNEGDFYESHPYDLKRIGNILPNCTVCGQKYEKEPGFYYGAMYVAYALGVALFVTCWTSFNLFFPSIPIGWEIGIIIFLTLVTAPYFYSLSKIIWANMFMKYDENAIKQHEKSTNS